MIQTVLVGIFAFAVAQIFFYTFQMTIDTILLCFCEDCYQNDGVPMRNAALREVINSNSAKAPVPASIIYKKGNGKLTEFDILVKTDKWALKDLVRFLLFIYDFLFRTLIVRRPNPADNLTCAPLHYLLFLYLIRPRRSRVATGWTLRASL